jgi:hypothetical protein
MVFCSWIIPFLPQEAKSQIKLETDKTRIQTHSGGGISISTDRPSINIPRRNTRTNNRNNFDDWNNYYFRDDYSFDSRTICSQQNRQTTRIVGSHREVQQHSTLSCH